MFRLSISVSVLPAKHQFENYSDCQNCVLVHFTINGSPQRLATPRSLVPYVGKRNIFMTITMEDSGCSRCIGKPAPHVIAH